jgi:hypothetical protein
MILFGASLPFIFLLIISRVAGYGLKAKDDLVENNSGEHSGSFRLPVWKNLGTGKETRCQIQREIVGSD